MHALLLGEHLLFDLLDLAAERLVGLQQVRDGFARVEHRGVVAPMVVSGALVCCLARYMAICRAWAISRVRSVELKRAKSRFR